MVTFLECEFRSIKLFRRVLISVCVRTECRKKKNTWMGILWCLFTFFWFKVGKYFEFFRVKIIKSQWVPIGLWRRYFRYFVLALGTTYHDRTICANPAYFLRTFPENHRLWKYCDQCKNSILGLHVLRSPDSKKVVLANSSEPVGTILTIISLKRMMKKKTAKFYWLSHMNLQIRIPGFSENRETGNGTWKTRSV